MTRFETPDIVLIAAVASNMVIGRQNTLPWHIPEDLRHFKQMTLGQAVLMGRHTWESLPNKFRPLPSRQNLVLTHDSSYNAPGARVVNGLPQALSLLTKLSTPIDTAFVIGGAKLYASALPLAKRMELTEIARDFTGDVYFPHFDPALWELVNRKAALEHSEIPFSFASYRRLP